MDQFYWLQARVRPAKRLRPRTSQGMEFDEQKKSRQAALDEKKKRLEEMRRRRQEATTSVDDSSTRQEVDTLVSSLLASGNESIVSDSVPSHKPIDIDTSSNTKKIVNLTTVRKLNTIHIFPRVKETYDKECQTDLAIIPIDGDMDNGNSNQEFTPQKLSHRRPRSVHTTNIGTPNKPTAASISPLPTNSQPNNIPEKKAISEEEKKMLLHSNEFKDFIESKTKLIERVLTAASSNVDFMRDYTSDCNSNLLSTSKMLSILSLYHDDFIRNRPIMDICVSPHFPELFAVAYGADSTSTSRAVSINDRAPGVICIWSLALKGRPEFKFTASSPVLAVRFHEQDPHLVIGGCYSGQILLWDIRAKSLPVQRSNMAGKGHKHPVYSLCMVGTGSSLEIISVSTDGTVCHWDINHLAEPTSVNPLQITVSNSSESTLPMTINGMVYAPGETSNDIIFGTGNGSLLRTAIPFRVNDPIEQIDAHMGLITAMSIHPPTNNNIYSNLLLTTSFDWTVKLWNLKESKFPIAEFVSTNYDYVCDVQWSPIYPPIFATVTSSGQICIWDITSSLAAPVDILRIIKDSNDSNSAAVTLNKLTWSTDSSKIFVGDISGSIAVINVQDKLLKKSVGNDLLVKVPRTNSV